MTLQFLLAFPLVLILFLAVIEFASLQSARILFIHKAMAFARLLPSASVLLLFAACLPKPEDDYKDYLAATQDQRAQPTSKDGGTTDSSAAKGAFKSIYFAVCSSPLAAGDMTKTFRFLVDLDYAPSGTGATAKQMYLNTLKTAARTFSRSEVVGDPIKFDNVPIDAKGRFSPQIPVAIIAGPGNPNSGRDIQIDNLALSGLITEQPKFCFSFKGKAVKPIVLDFEASCLLFEMKDGDKFDFSAATDKVLIPSLNLELTEDKFVCN